MRPTLTALSRLVAIAAMTGFTLASGTLFAQGKPGAKGRDTQDVAPLNEQNRYEQLEAFRRQRLSGDYVFKFELVHYPRRGQKVRYDGVMWGSWNEKGPISRIAIYPKSDKPVPPMEFIIQNGYEPVVWKLGKNGRATQMSEEELRTPMIEGIVYTAFDLLMPFIYWDDFEYAGADRRSGRPHDTFTMLPPSSWRKQAPDLAGVNVVIDRNFTALNQVEEIDKTGKSMRTFKVVSFKEVDDEYIVKEIDLVDEVSRDKTRFRVLAAGVNISLPQSTFDYRALGRGLPQINTVPFRPL